MNFSQLIEFRNLITKFYTIDSSKINVAEIRRDFSYAKDQVIATPDFKNSIESMVNQLSELDQAIEQNRALYQVLVKKVDHEIAKYGENLFNTDYINDPYTAPDLIMDDAVREEIIARLHRYTNWQWPALEVAARNDQWLKQMVASDPLYVMSPTMAQVDAVTSEFNSNYRRRIRGYQLDQMDQLPQEQFGFIFSWGFFNQLDIKATRFYLEKAFGLLKPGGTFMFSFNDGDTMTGAGMAENGVMSYMPLTRLKPVCIKTGFEIANVQHRDNAVNWIEIHKPGWLTSIKRSQTLGEIRIINN